MSLFGQKYRRSLKLLWTPENKDLAMKRLDFIAEQYSQADYERPEDLTLEDLLEQFRSTKYISINKDYKKRLERTINYYLTELDVPLRQMDYIESMISNVAKIELNEGRNSNGIRQDLKRLSQLFNFGINRGKIAINPAKLVRDQIRALPVDRDAMNIEEYKAVLQHLRDNNRNQTADALEIVFNTGMRIGEIIAMRRSDIDFASNILTIRGKGSRIRTFPLTGRFNNLRTLLLDTYNKEYDKVKLFVWNHNSTPQRQIRNAQKKLGFRKDGLNFHSVRKLFINSLIDEDYPLRSAAELVGHTVRIMERHYLKRQSTKTQSEIANKHKNNTKL